MSTVRACAIVLALAAVAFAQEKKVEGTSARSRKYENKDLHLTFSGVYGWQTTFATGAGAWSELARYAEPALDASVVLLVSSNPHGAYADLKKSVEEEFKAGGEPEPGKMVYKEVEITETPMKKGAKLPGVQAAAYALTITDEGKKREQRILSRTYFGREHLFRIHCVVRRARAKRVEDLFVRALGGLVVESAKERATRGTTFQSGRGRWSCLVPDGYKVFLPPQNWNSDAVFENKQTGILISVYAYAFKGVVDDQVDEMLEYYGDEIAIPEEEAMVLGAEGFNGVLTKPESVTIISGTVRRGIAYRVHTSGKKRDLDAIKKAHAEFLKAMKTSR